MSQFEIKRYVPFEIFGQDASFTNSSLFMVLAVLLITVFFAAAMRNRALVPGRLQSVAEMSYEFIANMVRENVGDEGMKYFPFIFSLFVFVLALNMLGMIPFLGSPTASIAVTSALALIGFVYGTLGAVLHGTSRLAGIDSPCSFSAITRTGEIRICSLMRVLIWSIGLPFPANEMDIPAGFPSGWFPLRRKLDESSS